MNFRTMTLNMLRSNFNTREFNSRELVQMCSTLLETVVFVFDHLWTQDSPMFPLTFGGKAGPYIDQGGSKLKAQIVSNIFKIFT